MWYVPDVLSQEQEQDGFAVFEDEDFVCIKRFGEVILVFSSVGATRESMREALKAIRKGKPITDP